MDATRRKIIKLSALTAASLVVGGCGGSDAKNSEDAFLVTLHPTDSMVPHDTDRIALKFSKPVDQETLNGNIWLNDQTGNLVHLHTVAIDSEDTSHQTVLIILDSGYRLNDSWRYTVSVNKSVKSTAGESLDSAAVIELVTTSRSPFEKSSSEEIRTKIMVISDLHLNQQRAADDKYGLFVENSKLMRDFLDNVKQSEQIKELIILGDLMDMWVLPMSYETFEGSVTDTKGYFLSVANAEINSGITERLNAIADEGNIQLTYVPGNHDMHFSKDIFKTIFPNGIFKGDDSGTGVYFPEKDIACEHGHNYDVFNAPDPLTSQESILPPGYFITRIFATGNLPSNRLLKTAEARSDIQKALYKTSWDIAVASFLIPDLDLDKPQIVTEAGGYKKIYSINGARDIYSDTIGPDWQQRQVDNGVYQPDLFSTGILNASGIGWFGTMEGSATLQYLLPDRAKIVVFGHTHHAMIKKDFWTAEKIYANSGTWIDDKHVSKDALGRTCVVINSSQSSGSEVDCVTVYQCQEDATLKNVGEEYI